MSRGGRESLRHVGNKKETYFNSRYYSVIALFYYLFHFSVYPQGQLLKVWHSFFCDNFFMEVELYALRVAAGFSGVG